MPNTQLMDTPWLDILPPPPPTGQSEWLLLVVSIGMTVLLAAVYRYWQSRPRQRALRELKRLQQLLQQKQLDQRQCLFAINRQLRLGFKQSQLLRFNPRGREHDWQQFYTELTRQQYQRDRPDQKTTTRLLLSACALLRDIRP